MVKYDKNGVAYCVGTVCFFFTTYFYWNKKKLRNPIVRCCREICPLDNLSTKEVNEDLEKNYPIQYTLSENGAKK